MIDPIGVTGRRGDDAVFGREAHPAAAAVLLALDGAPHTSMGQEFGDPGWRDWTVLFDDWRPDWSAFDYAVFALFRASIDLRRRDSALRHGAVSIYRQFAGRRDRPAAQPGR